MVQVMFLIVACDNTPTGDQRRVVLAGKGIDYIHATYVDVSLLDHQGN